MKLLLSSPCTFPGRRFLAAVALLSLAAVPNLLAGGSYKENLDIKAALLPTADAPAGATGAVELNAFDKNGTTPAVLTVGTRWLTPATYSVSVVLKSDTTTVPLGDLVITGSTASSKLKGVVFGSRKGPALPAGLDPFDIGTVFVSDTNSVVILNADLTAKQGVQVFRAVTAPITPGIAAPNAQGSLNLVSHSKNGSEKSVITLFARKVPAHLSFVVNVNGTDIGQGVSTKNGQIRLGQTPGKHLGFAGFGQQISGIDLHSVTLTTVPASSGTSGAPMTTGDVVFDVSL